MKLYLYGTVITFDKDKLDDYIFIQLSKYRDGYPTDEHIATEWESVEEHECDIPNLIEWLKNGYSLLEQGGVL